MSVRGSVGNRQHDWQHDLLEGHARYARLPVEDPGVVESFVDSLELGCKRRHPRAVRVDYSNYLVGYLRPIETLFS